MKVKFNLKDLKISPEKAMELISSFCNNNTKELKGGAIFKMMKLKKAIGKQFELIGDVLKNLQNEYAMKDDKGEIIIGENGTISIDKENVKEFFDKQNDAINNSEDIEMDISEIKVEDIDKYVISIDESDLLYEIGIIKE